MPGCEPVKPCDWGPVVISEFPSKEEMLLESFRPSIFSKGHETRLNYGLTGCGSSSISCKSSTITHAFTHEQAYHPISCKRQSPEISALDRSSNVVLPLFILPISLSSLFFSIWVFGLFRPMTCRSAMRGPYLKNFKVGRGTDLDAKAINPLTRCRSKRGT